MNKERKIIINCASGGESTPKPRTTVYHFDEDSLDKLEKELKALQEDKWISVEDELNRAKKLHPNYPFDMFRQVAIMNEEAGEVTKAVLHYHYENGSLDDIKKELIQTMAMCMRMLESLPKPPKEK